MLHIIEKAIAEPEFKVRLDYREGVTVLVDFAPIIEEGGVFSALSDPAIFRQITIGRRGRSLCWPGDIDFCADALRQEGRVIDRKVSSTGERE